jgi:plasmid stabilization system protein ParE
VFNPLEYNGIPLERQTRDWRELDVAPIDPESSDPYAVCRVVAVNGIENEAIQFEYQIARNHADSDIRRELDFLAGLSERQHRVVDRLLPETGGVLETALEYEHAAVDLDSWLARGEPDPQRREVYEADALEDFDHLYRYAEALETIRRAERVVDDVADALSERRAAGEEPYQPEGGRERTTAPLSDLNALTMLSVEQLMRTFYRSADPDRIDPSTRPAYREISRDEEEQVLRHQALVDPGTSWLEQFVMHQYNECYLYYSFLQQETDPRVRAVWELYLDMELARLQAARDLLRRVEDRDADEIVGNGLPEPLGFEQNRQFLRRLLATRLDPEALGSGAIREVPEVREVRERLENVPGTDGDGAPDVIDALIGQHRRIEALFNEVEAAADERRQAVWDELVGLLSAHEGVEGELVHPLARATLVGGFDVVRDLVDSERKIRQLLLRLVDAGVESPDFADTVTELRDAVLSHARDEERFEFPQLRDRVPAEQLRELASAMQPAVPA